MTTSLATPPKLQFFDLNGAPLSGGKLYTYVAGTTTPQASYTDYGGATANTNPVILNSRGEASVWLGTALYKMALYDSTNVLIWTVDNLNGGDVATLAQLAASGGSNLVGYLPAGTGAVATTVQAKLRESVSVFDFMTAAQVADVINGTGSISISAAWQSAINYCRDSATCKTIVMPPGSYLHTTTLNVTTAARSGISCIGIGGRRGGVKIKCSTGAWAIELIGSAWTRWTGLYFTHGTSTISKGTFLLGGTVTDAECLNHNFENIFIDTYNASAPSSYGTIGYGVIGSEENTWIATQTYAGTPVLISTLYSTISADYPATYQTIQSSHSAGVNTFTGENSLVCWDLLSANVVLYGANSLDLGNAYFSNINIGSPGSAVEAIRVLGATLEGVRGKIKVESKQILLNITSASTQMTGWDLDCQWGAITANTDAWIKYNNTAAFTGEFVNSNITINLYDSTASVFNGKAIMSSLTAMDELGIGKFANLDFSINKPLANIGLPWFPATMVGASQNVAMHCLDATYTLKDRATQRLDLQRQFYLGLGNAAPSTIANIKLPAIVAGLSSRSGTVTVEGIIHNQNWADGSAGDETDVSECPFIVANGFISPNSGVIAVGAAGGDSWITPSSSAVSTNSASYLFTGVKLDLVYTAGTRTIAVNVGPKGTGPNIGAILAFINGLSIEMKTIGRREELIYISV